jgi:CDP-4-dehydro-6-deoxyglucose reductase, E3
MTQLLTVSRAARLVGVARGTLQKKIKCGDLTTFEGMVDADDLLRAYPKASLEDNTFLERLTRIKEEAFAHRIRERILPSAEVLAARLQEMTRDHSTTKAMLEQYKAILDHMITKIDELEKSGGDELRSSMASLKRWLQDWHDTSPEEADYSQPLLLKDSFLRLMAAHVKVQPSGHDFFVEGNDSILDAALRAGLALEYGCSSGNCGQCKARVVSGHAQKIRPHDYVLSDADKNMGYMLLCSNTAVTDLVIEAPEASGAQDIPVQHITTRVKRVEPLSDEITLLHLQTPRTNRLRFLAGQNARLEFGDSIQVEHPIASCPCDDRNIQFHIRVTQDDATSAWVAHLKSSDPVAIEGPSGNFVLKEDSTRPLIFFACDIGFAPIKSLIEHAMALDTSESLHLYWLATKPGGHYMENLCRSWADALDNFHYTSVTAESTTDQDPYLGNILARMTQDHPTLADYDLYVAGPDPLVNAAQFALLDAGLPESQLSLGNVR